MVSATVTPEGSGSTTVTAVVDTSVSEDILLDFSGPPSNIIVTTDIPPNSSLPPEEQTTVTAYVTDSSNNPVYDGITVYFFLDGVSASIDETAKTRNGFATATFTAGQRNGQVQVSAETDFDPTTGLNASGVTTIPVSDGQAAVISFLSVEPDDFIAIRGSGQNELAELTFRVQDSSGNPVPNGTTIAFSLEPEINGGAELVEETASTLNGEVAARIQSGYVAGPLRVQATYTSPQGVKVTSQGIVAVVSGKPDNRHLSMSQKYFNQAGFLTDGLLNNFYLALADRYGNIIKDGTPINFISDCGRIGTNAVGVDALDSFTTTTIDGKASTEFRTGNPIRPLCNIVGYTSGEESFDDLNANGIYDSRVDICTGDQGEPFLDENLNNVHDIGELYIDVDLPGNTFGSYDGPNKVCDMNTVIWGSSRVIMSSYVGDITVRYFDSVQDIWVGNISSVTLTHGESLSLRFDAGDVNDSPLVQGTAVKVTAETADEKECEGLAILGDTEYTLTDRLGSYDTFSLVLFDSSVHDAAEAIKSCILDFTVTPPATVDPGFGTNGPPYKESLIVYYQTDP
ncbi:MAG: hypothetical protein C0614_10110 [Desulfuromonas sp.]|nr:MAG: hypothetical protein C0614_10110 [Desulfuromonas sp.]